MSVRFPVIYLTGAPATGKSTLARNLATAYPALRVFSYSEELRKFLAQKTSSVLDEDKIRELSAKIVTAEDIQALDRALVHEVAAKRSERPFLVDSHAVTKETYGFRVTGFDVEILRALQPDVIVCLYTSAETVRSRIASNPMGRPMVTESEAMMHIQLQAALAMQYGILVGKPVYLIDSAAPEPELVRTVALRAKLEVANSSIKK
jgi:adenylate kinase